MDESSFQLFADLFTPADQQEFAGLHFGDEDWSKAAAEWISGSEVLDSMEKHQTKVWTFRTDDDEIAGFGSLGLTRRPYPAPSDDYKRLLIFPQLGLVSKFHGYPPATAVPEDRYSNQILNHLLFEANDWAIEHNADRPQKKHIKEIVLLVHKENFAAQRLYTRFDFKIMPDFVRDNLIMMAHSLNLDH